MTQIEFVNHASLVVNHGRVRLICDPWLEGSVFDNGWDLLTEPQFPYARFREITHIWFSHEHPDHFNTLTLNKISEALRPNITILYQDSVDKKVVRYCTDMGFGRVIEMKSTEWIDLGDDLEVHCEMHDNGDSWLAVRSPDTSILNLNDCVLHSHGDLGKVARTVGQVDVLATQFSYANRVGNPGDRPTLDAAAEEKLRWLKSQILHLSPRYVIPFASFSYFSHEDNWYLNAGINRIDRVEEFIRRESLAKPVVLYPADVWDTSNTPPHDSESRVQHYLKDCERVLRQGFIHKSQPVPLDKLLEDGDGFIKKLRAKNGFLARFVLPTLKIFVEDHAQILRLTMSGIKPISESPHNADIVCKSDALDHFFLWKWVGRTLDINGRFWVPDSGQYWKAKSYATLASFNNRGEGLRETLKTAQRRYFKNRGRLT